ncbi:MAG: hypothetical protein ACHRXM_17325 [Isosphaerales bacterium]
MAEHPIDPSSGMQSSSSSRRGFLQQAAVVTTGIAVLPAAAAAAERPFKGDALPSVALGAHRVSRLIIGGNPIYGYSHFNRLFSQHQTDWHTPEHVVELLLRCEECGLNTWQNSYAERTLSDLDRYRKQGGSMNWLCLGKPDWDEHPDHIDHAARSKPIGIAPHGALGEKLHRQKKHDVLTGLLKRIRDQGVLVGLSAHDPRLIETAEEKGWDVDYYMCCLYYLTRPKDELRRILGPDLPLGEIYLPSDPPRMFKTIQATRKPCLVYKVLAAGRRVGNPVEVRRCFAEAFANIKPVDAVIVGMYQQLGDQVGENAAIVRSLCSKA